ncbi:MAG: MaoC family dehydratase N-terminal domain-containing protein [Chloroflexota bacterium]|nr:MaoC family dehydratase N-terminal domain-containing protein [Chloroflexota bacterium]
MTQATDSVITDEMRAVIGVEGPPTTLEVEKTNCRMFARSVGHRDPIFYDEAAAKARGYRSIVAPPGFMGTPVFNPNSGGGGAPGEMGGRGYSIPYKRVLNGGTDYEYFPEADVICAGDTITARSKVSGFEESTGSLGPMLITKRETTYTNQHGKVVAKMYGTVIQY